eukprot:TRINITY_DN2933_c0_g1_i2.p1 TRINITY_DN2933_c0_g1~~TRINITY_DN2933_c0_g1_i2.p1  ORF type:complete len:427 (-),score=101.75 TRINITY_DN2933_c0_g1_i2:547-1827(-)
MYRPGPAQNQGKNPAYGIQPLRALPVVPPQNNYQYENNAKQTFYQQHWKQLNPKAKKKRCTCCCICCSFFLVIIVIAVLLFLWAKCDLACTKVKRYSLDPNIESGFKLANDDHAIQNDEYDTVKVLNKRGDLVVNPSSDDFKNMYIEPDSETQFAVNLVSSCAFTSSELKEKMDLPTEPKDGNTFEMEYIKSGKGYYDKCFCRLANLYLTFAGSETEDTDISLDHIYGDIVYSRNSTEDYTNHFKSISTTNVNGEIKVKSGVSLKSKGDVNFEIKSPEATVTSIVNGIVTSNDILIENGAEIIANGKFTVKSQSPRGDIEISGAVKASSAEVSVSQSLTGTSHFNDGGFIEICPKNISGDLACHSNIESFTNSGKKSQSVSVVSERHEYSGQDFPPLVRVQGDVGLIEVRQIGFFSISHLFFRFLW